MNKLLTVISLITFVSCTAFSSPSKPFKKALVIGGGGITPGVALGMIAGAKDAGYNPDVILAACGASLGAALYGSFSSPKEALKYAKSEEFYLRFQKLVRLGAWSALGLKNKMQTVLANPKNLPEIFEGNILKIPNEAQGLLPSEKFPLSKNKSRLIILAARASFGPEHQGKDTGTGSLFRESYLTDAATANELRGFESPVKKSFPYSRVDRKTEVRSDVALSQAVRASITDPFYVNPTRIGNSYYWGGAVDLFPVETAQHLAEEVLMNFPGGLYNRFEDLAISSTYGFAQSDRTTEVSRLNDIKWIDTSGSHELGLDPGLFGVLFINRFPSSHEKFAYIIQKQFNLGYARAVEAVRLQKNRVNVRTHLRHTEVGRQ
ncbi:hypothetical protein AZI86_09705 [Bdellovibrio bacteriovorus]|uniref:PNPLA domain-containing protein n=1 Tax=Bdellovibrio bacteriovorus TaxID=959 RepID=A0A150WSL2_BDEBC|nr:patatin-like phospholipase family protein [Bdellovibrio bacteriovorus]KYG67269.1 hypothetical protein AZI86_09705 [Bdellovibrio bacteriovorus]